VRKEIKLFKKGQSSLSVKINTPVLEQLEETLKKRFVAHVGILGSKNTRATTTTNSKGKQTVTKNESLSALTNAQIGLAHEFGVITKHIPERSFLRVPLLFHLKEKVDESASRINKAIMAGDALGAYALLGIAGEKVIQNAFATRGDDNWPINEETGRGSLIDSGQLRKSISSEVVIA
jgi:predicted transcriptional regulator